MTKKRNYKITAAFIIIALCLALTGSLLAIFYADSDHGTYIADIYQDGVLLQSIPLSEVTSPYRFTVTGEGGCTNEIEVRDGAIAVISADCPDKLCVHQGFISNTRLPIVCLPNRLVIRLRENSCDAPDALAY